MPTIPPKRPLRLFVFAAFLCASLAYMCWSVSTMVYGRFVEREEILGFQKQLVSFQPCTTAPWQNRVLFPLMVDAASRAGKSLTFQQWYHLFRYVWIFGALLAMFYLLVRVAKVNARSAAVGTGMLAYMMAMTFFGLEVPSDVPDAFFFILLIWFAFRKKAAYFILTSLLAAFNRESCAFSGIIWFALHGIDDRNKINVRHTLFAAGCSVASFALVEYLRFAFSGFQAPPEQWIIGYQVLFSRCIESLAGKQNAGWAQHLIFTAAPVGLWLMLNRDRVTGKLGRLYLGAWTMVAITLVSGDVVMNRVFIPTYVLFVFIAAATEPERSTSF